MYQPESILFDLCSFYHLLDNKRYVWSWNCSRKQRVLGNTNSELSLPRNKDDLLCITISPTNQVSENTLPCQSAQQEDSTRKYPMGHDMEDLSSQPWRYKSLHYSCHILEISPFSLYGSTSSNHQNSR